MGGARSLPLHAGIPVELTWRVIETFGVTNFAAAPTVYRSLGTGTVFPPAARGSARPTML